MFKNNKFRFIKIAIVVLCSISMLQAETFADLFKLFKLDYLDALLTKHPEITADLDAMFKIEKTYNVEPKFEKKVISFSLFWKSPYAASKQPTVNPEQIHLLLYKKNKKKISFHDNYVKPLIAQLKNYKQAYPDWIARIYLANDLQFLIPEFLELEVEIFLMASNSIAASPGAMWRFLVFDDPTVKAAYVRDADFMNKRFDGDFSMSTSLKDWINSPDTKGFFRLRDLRRMSETVLLNGRHFSPIVAGSWGGKKVSWIKMETAMKGFILHRMLNPDEPRHVEDTASDSHPYGFGNQFPDYGFDERFLKHVLYFAAADRDQLTLFSTDDPKRHGEPLPDNRFVRLDLEYTKYKSYDGY